VSGKSPAFVWDGRDAAGSRVRDGVYRITLWAEDVSANRSQRGLAVTVDTRPASVATTAGSGFVTPDGDDKADTLALRWSSNQGLTGSIRIKDRVGRTVRSWSFSRTASGGATWNGRMPTVWSCRTPRTRSASMAVTRAEPHDRGQARFGRPHHPLGDLVGPLVRPPGGTAQPSVDRAPPTRRDHGRDLPRQHPRPTRLDRHVPRCGDVHAHWDGRTASGAFATAGTYRIKVTARSWIGTTTYSRNVVVERH
jgi:hypothetical protein